VSISKPYFILLLITGFISQTTFFCSITTGIAISGTKAISPTGDYPLIAAALLDIAIGPECPVILDLQSAYVISVETFPITFRNYRQSQRTLLHKSIVQVQQGYLFI
jgi:hypothetical protein